MKEQEKEPSFADHINKFPTMNELSKKMFEQSATVEEAASKYLMSNFDSHERAVQDAFIAGYTHAQQSKPIDERHWEMEPLEPETKQLKKNPRLEELRSRITPEKKAEFDKQWDELYGKPETMGGKTLEQSQEDFWNFGYADYDLVTGDPENMDFDKLDQEVVNAIFKAGWEAKAQHSQPQWREVGKELPEVDLLLVCQNDEIYVSFYDGIRKPEFSHWMPLPQPPTTK